MDKIQEKNQKLILNLIYFSFVFGLVYLFGLGMKLDLNFIIKIIIIFIGTFIVKFLLFNPLVLYVLLAIIFLGAVLANHYITPFIFDFLERIYFLFQNIILHVLGKEKIAENNILLFWGILLILVSLFTAFVMFKNKEIYILLPVYLGFFIYYWYNFYDEAYWMISIFLLGFLILMGLDKYSKRKLIVENSLMSDFEDLYPPWLRTVAIYSIIIVSIALLLPKGYDYIQWSWLQQKVYSSFPKIEELRSYNTYVRGNEEASIFDFRATGFGEDSDKLGGPVRLSDRKIMTVHADSSTYLRGNVKHIYTGNSWEAIIDPSNTYGLNQDLIKLSQKEKDLYYKEFDITIINHEFASTTLFSPYRPALVNFVHDSFVKVNRDDSLTLLKGVYEGESYFIRAQKPLPYGVLVYNGINLKKKDLKDLDIYLQLPKDKITERTKDLVKKITLLKKNDFEKAVAIENYLRNNYEYNLNVDEVPENQEFIDYFLFDSKEGYCTYYATSMAVMLRLAGIPSRYIEGFLVQDSVEKGIYEVRNKDAHAWVEAFIEPAGWMTFEATTPYAIETRLENYNPFSETIKTPPREVGEIENNPRDEINDLNIDTDEDIAVDKWTPDFEIPYEEIPPKLSRNLLIIIAGILLLIIPLRFLIGLFKYIYLEHKAKKLSNNKKIIYLYKQIHKIIDLLGYPQKYGETHNEYARRVSYKFYDYNEKGIKEITEIFVKSKYSSYPTLDEDVLELMKYRKTLEKRLKEHLGKRSYYYGKYVKWPR